MHTGSPPATSVAVLLRFAYVGEPTGVPPRVVSAHCSELARMLPEATYALPSHSRILPAV